MTVVKNQVSSSNITSQIIETELNLLNRFGVLTWKKKNTLL